MSRLKDIVKGWFPARWDNANYDAKLDPRIKEMFKVKPKKENKQ